jgi:3-deoxy-manno-octulosonate cytidylyltransferase (CMP-KDO synthetase)
MKTLIVIPARYASSRLPAKPLLAETGTPLIQHTYEQAKKSSADRVIVATDDARIEEAVKGFGGEVVMTSPAHESGTARVAEAAEGIDADIVINMQGDEPEVDPAHLDQLIDIHAKAMKAPFSAFASTLVCPFAPTPATGPGSPQDPSCVKAVLTQETAGVRQAVYFSRALVPYPRDAEGQVLSPSDYYLHIGIYAFSPDTLNAFAGSMPSPLEQTEKLEQLRILEAGHKMAVTIVSQAAPGIDTPEDYAAFVARQRS